ncbi:MAG: hypothetical protein JNK29_11670 [Anaerolineales bacterium]|nr:hypothetical protein [Anaerolineales bacterium]
MKARLMWLLIGLAFAVTLAVVIGQRLSAEAMAVMVGVVAGVAASIPTSLIVVWFASRTLLVARPAPAAPPPAPEPRVVVMPQPAPAAYQSLAGYAPAMYGQPLPLTMPGGAMPAAGPAYPAPRQFNVIGGAELGGAEMETGAEVVWQG